MSDTPTTAEEMREAAARACEMVEDAMWAKWKARYDPSAQGASLGAGRCSNIIRAIPCAPDPRIAALEAERDRLRKALIDATAHLAATVSLLESGGKKAAASDKMFCQMLLDYKASLKRARTALEGGADG